VGSGLNGNANGCGLLCGGVIAANDSRRLIYENGECTIADSTSRDATLPVRLGAFKPEALCARTGGDYGRIGGLRFSIFLVLAPVSEGSV